MSDTSTATPSPPVAHHFEDAQQQHHAAGLGMWTFLVTEVLFFGGLFTAYIVYRMLHPEAFAEASHHLYRTIGLINTAVLLVSSFFVALAVHAAAHNAKRMLVWTLSATVLLAVVFLGLKTLEYVLDIHDRILPGPLFNGEMFTQPGHAELFFVLYWFMTGLHALHVSVGIAVLGTLTVRAWWAWRTGTTAHLRNVTEMTGLYWHFVDIVWIFLYPLLYLVR